ncbi:unnamed protein product [Prorocentrum cordatum]|uniref:Uncharacterized protein n=1 Tax=Prorocentrum cordatum TaxID=2364126 RepID=A0ABN9T5R4_9DINO|nr:unnamed protein product [Polarella glacialis]
MSNPSDATANTHKSVIRPPRGSTNPRRTGWRDAPARSGSGLSRSDPRPMAPARHVVQHEWGEARMSRRHGGGGSKGEEGGRPASRATGAPRAEKAARTRRGHHPPLCGAQSMPASSRKRAFSCSSTSTSACTVALGAPAAFIALTSAPFAAIRRSTSSSPPRRACRRAPRRGPPSWRARAAGRWGWAAPPDSAGSSTEAGSARARPSRQCASRAA